MKNKIMETQISDALETIARALRAYTDKPLICNLFVETREEIPEKGTDFYSFSISLGDETIFEKGERISYDFDLIDGEYIRETYNCFRRCKEGDDDDS